MRIYIKCALYLSILIGVSYSYADAYVDFFRAVDVDNASGVQALLERGFDPNTLSEYGQTGLFLAMREESLQVAEVLLASPSLKIDAVNFAGETAVMMAALRGRLDWTKRLADRGARIKRPGWTPLHYAASGPNVAVVAYLLDQGSDIDAVAPNGNTPLMMAVRYGEEESVKLLVQRGADKKRLNDRNLSAADLARNAEKFWLLPLLQ